MYDAAANPEIETAEERLARHSAMLRRLQDLSMTMAEAIARQAEAEAAAGALDSGAAALALGRAAKSVRQSVALEDRLHQAREDRARDDRTRADAAAPDPAEDRALTQKYERRLWMLYGRDKIHDAVEKVIEHERLAESDAERLLADLNERLEDEDEVRALMAMSTGKAVDRICGDLGLTIDWSLWKGQVWVEEYIPILETQRDWAAKQASLKARAPP
jgi:hypothetical protein